MIPFRSIACGQNSALNRKGFAVCALLSSRNHWALKLPWPEIPAEVRPAVRQRLKFRTLTVEGRYDSKLDGATKVLFRTTQGYLVETVMLRSESGRTSLCVSSQVGCAANCEFCATGKMGMAHDLSAAEMLDQIVVAGELLAEEGRRVRNIVFMGMGEPFHNEPSLYETVSALLDPRLFHHTPGRILISSVGIPAAMIRAAGRFPEVHLALSLHSARQDFRQQIIPLAARYSLTELRQAVERINQIQRCSVMIEYLMLAGRNDSADDAYKLAEWLKGLRVYVNLIPFNPVREAPHLKSTDRAGRDAFATILKIRWLHNNHPLFAWSRYCRCLRSTGAAREPQDCPDRPAD